MQAVLLIGIQASGKSTFYRQRFVDSHVRINLDMLNTRHREERFLAACIDTKMPFVVDNTNPSRADRARYIAPAKAAGMTVVGYYFRSSIDDSLSRNSQRAEDQRIPDSGVRATHARLELPSRQEGFDELYYVTMNPDDGFEMQEWRDEV